jgi:hypothetical protein
VRWWRFFEVNKKEYLWFKDETLRTDMFEIGVLIGEIELAKEMLEDLQYAVMCKPTQYQRLLQEFEKQIEEIHFRAGFLIKRLSLEKGKDC